MKAAKTKNVLVMPSLLNNPVYVSGLTLEAVAEILDSNGQHEHARSLRYAGEICKAYAKVNLIKEVELVT